MSKVMHQNRIPTKQNPEEDKQGPLDIAEKGSQIGKDWFEELIKKDFPRKDNEKGKPKSK